MDILKQYLPLCWFEQDPTQLPPSADFFRNNLIFYYFVELFMQMNMIEWHEAILEVTLETCFTLFFVAIVLALNHSFHNYVQVATSILVCENVIAIFGVPITVWLTVTEDAISYYIFAMLIIWDVALITFILKKMLSINLSASLAVSCIYFIITYGGAYGLTIVVFG